MRSRLKLYLMAVTLALLPVCFGIYIQYEARSWWLSFPLGRASYAYYMFGAIFLFVVEILTVAFVLQLLYQQW